MIGDRELVTRTAPTLSAHSEERMRIHLVKVTSVFSDGKNAVRRVPARMADISTLYAGENRVVRPT
ncbi:hypothetical protein NWI01_35220 [Nitrobacter winogradskyi]|uniref:Uncharacterized protein n=1 Tax=Nitrobacter winogradskyi TaxID=913 RepID=A0A4Y3WHL5_NITWI|nr:hypothetical protein NWI01_35220 [Nitrobacter winogradskyi]